MIICHCQAVTDEAIRDAVRSGSKTLCQVGQICRAGSECAGCRPAIEKIIRSESREISSPASLNSCCSGPDNLVPLSVVQP